MAKTPRLAIANPKAGRLVRARKAIPKPRSAKASSEEDVPKSRGNDPLSRYMRDITATAPPLLTGPQEKALGRLLEEHLLLAAEKMYRDLLDVGKAAKSRRITERGKRTAAAFLRELNPDKLRGRALKKHLFLTLRGSSGPEYFQRYAERDGKDVAELFVTANLRLVITMARKYGKGVMPMEELVQEGNIGLMRSVLAFDYRRGFRFSTYSAWWVRHAIGRAIADKSRLVREPVHMSEFSTFVAKTRQRLIGELGRPPDDDEVAEAIVRADSAKARCGSGSDEEKGLSMVEKVRKLSTQTRMPVSLDQPVRGDEGDGVTQHELLEAEPEDRQVWEPLVPGASLDLLHRALTRLKPIEAEILRQRFGLDNDEERTFQEIGTRYGLSRERIRQLQESALRKLRSDKDLRPLVQEIAAL